jgi:hypothetical protein
MSEPTAPDAFNDGHRVVIANLAQYYDAWLEAARAASALDFVFQWKQIPSGGKVYEYLYRMTDSGKGIGKSLMPRNAAATDLFATHAQLKSHWLALETERYTRLTQEARQYRALRLGLISSPAAYILQMLDIHGVLGGQYLVVGTNALPVYEIEAGERFAASVDSTEDFDMAWVGGALQLSTAQANVPQLNLARLLSLPEDAPLLSLLNESPDDLLGLLKRVDGTYTKNTERGFQARNAKGYEVEILLAKRLAAAYPKRARLSPIALPEQDWLLLGQPISHVITGLDATPARVVAPDPRYFALQKIWLSQQAKRKTEKRPKDARQAALVLDAIARSMPHYPLDDAFAATLPNELAPLFAAWRAEYHGRERNATTAAPAKRW